MTAPCDARCCDAAEVPLLEADIDRLTAATGRDPADFVDESDGWRLLRGTGMEGGCVFLGTVAPLGRPVRGCTVHTARPSACRQYPFILDGPPHALRVIRDALCPFRADFVPLADALGRLTLLERQLEEERAERRRHGAVR